MKLKNEVHFNSGISGEMMNETNGFGCNSQKTDGDGSDSQTLLLP